MSEQHNLNRLQNRKLMLSKKIQECNIYLKAVAKEANYPDNYRSTITQKRIYEKQLCDVHFHLEKYERPKNGELMEHTTNIEVNYPGPIEKEVQAETGKRNRIRKLEDKLNAAKVKASESEATKRLKAAIKETKEKTKSEEVKTKKQSRSDKDQASFLVSLICKSIGIYIGLIAIVGGGAAAANSDGIGYIVAIGSLVPISIFFFVLTFYITTCLNDQDILKSMNNDDAPPKIFFCGLGMALFGFIGGLSGWGAYVIAEKINLFNIF